MSSSLNGTVALEHQGLIDLVAKAFEGLDLSHVDAQDVFQVLVLADPCGSSTRGLSRVES